MNGQTLHQQGQEAHYNEEQPIQLLKLQTTQQLSIFTGGIGYNTTKPAETTATQFVVIEDIACTPTNGDLKGGSVQVRINTTEYFQNPDVTAMAGVAGNANPYPRGISDGTNNLLKSFDLYPDVYVLLVRFMMFFTLSKVAT